MTFGAMILSISIEPNCIIRTVADMDSDGRLSCDEFVVAMHLCDLAKTGENIPSTLPIELIPPAFRRQRQSSLTLSQSGAENIDPLAGMPQVSFALISLRFDAYITHLKITLFAVIL